MRDINVHGAQMREVVPIGIVGAGQTRGGLGPFLAEFVEQEGFFVAGVAGRSSERASINAEAIGRKLGHKVKPSPSPAALCASGIEALVVSSPADFHLEALQAAVEVGLPALCEKPLVHEKDVKKGAEVIEAFARKDLPLLENCQWPYLLAAFHELHGSWQNGAEFTVEMGLAPPRLGREMVQNTISHLLSVIQAMARLGPSAAVTEVSIADLSCQGLQNIVRFFLADGRVTVEAALHLELCPIGPRPAWLAINGRRIDRHVRQGYSVAFSANGIEVSVDDPVKEVVRHFALLVQNRDSVLMARARDCIRQRLEWYRQILERLQ